VIMYKLILHPNLLM
jgi:hypothetical protein